MRLRPENAPLHRPARFRATLEGFRDITHDMREFTFATHGAPGFLPGQYALFYLPGLGDLSNLFLPAETTRKFDIYYKGSLLLESGRILSEIPATAGESPSRSGPRSRSIATMFVAPPWRWARTSRSSSASSASPLAAPRRAS